MNTTLFNIPSNDHIGITKGVLVSRESKKVRTLQLAGRSHAQSTKLLGPCSGDPHAEEGLRRRSTKLRNKFTGLCSSRAQWPLAPNFCSRAIRKSYFFHTNHMLGTLDFTVSEHWAPFNFP